MISAVILNWDRPSALTDVILPVLERYANISEIIISHGRHETAFNYTSRRCRIVHREDWGINETYGLSRRFLAAKGAVNEIILHHDDDLILPERTLDRLLSHYQRRPNVIHSLFGRRPSLSLQYLYEDVTGDVLIALTGCSLVSKKLVEHCLGRYFQETHNFMRQSNFKTLWNGEDIYQSLVAFKHSGLLNKAYALPCVYLNSVLGNSMAISNNPII